MNNYTASIILQMMLGLASHEPHFSLLREEVKFGGKQKGKRQEKR